MAIDVMTFVNIFGKSSKLNDVLLKITECEMFHPEKVEKSSRASGFENVNESNPYVGILSKINKTLSMLGIDPKFEECSKVQMNDQTNEFIDNTFSKVKGYVDKISKINVMLDLMDKSLIEIEHMSKLSVKIDDVFASEHIDACFGRMPVDSRLKLDYFKDQLFFFVPLDQEKDFCWGIYITPSKCSDETRKCFKSLYFEEYCIPDYIHGTPQLAISNIKSQIAEEKANLEQTKAALSAFKAQNMRTILSVYSKVKILHDTFSYRKFAVVGQKKFHMNGFVLKKDAEKFVKMFDDMSEVVVETLAVEEIKDHAPPVKLRTGWLFRPFETYVKMYGLPRYEDMNPSSYMGLVYCLMFGMMFGDFGQGAVLLAAGLLIWKFAKNSVGLILNRCGAFSVLFGLIYGSCFGFEGVFAGFWKLIGLGAVFPMNLLEAKNSMNILIVSFIFGTVLILSSMSINVFLSLKNRQFGKALFSCNGIAGFLAYSSVFGAVILIMTSGINIFSPIFIVFAILIPLFIIFFSVPLSNAIETKIKKNKSEKLEKFSAVTATFDMIDIVLSYFSNTLSFLRVGGLALSHAALMLVVMEFSHMVGSLGMPIVVLLGNVFVMVLEGLIVSIQALRLIYYEIFSRFYNSDGKPFEPAKVVFEKDA